MDEEYISFNWDRHDTHLNYLLSNVCNKEIFSDAMLACDGCLYPVHKLVLAACSDYFCEIFDRIPCKNPVIILKDTKSNDLIALLEYMYLGKASIKNDDLESFLNAAESLRVKGLAVSDELLDPLALFPKNSENAIKSSRKKKPRKSLKVNGIDKNIIDQSSSVCEEDINDSMSDGLKSEPESEDEKYSSDCNEKGAVSSSASKRKHLQNDPPSHTKYKKLKFHEAFLSHVVADQGHDGEFIHEDGVKEEKMPPFPTFSNDVTPYLKGEPITKEQTKIMRDSLITQLINYLDENKLLLSTSKGKQVWGYRLVGKALLNAYPSIVKEFSEGKYQKRTPIGFLISKLAEKRRTIRKKLLSQMPQSNSVPDQSNSKPCTAHIKVEEDCHQHPVPQKDELQSSQPNEDAMQEQ